MTRLDIQAALHNGGYDGAKGVDAQRRKVNELRERILKPLEQASSFPADFAGPGGLLYTVERKGFALSGTLKFEDEAD